MKKKLLKYGKILMALTLIGALTLPSYATVGAADGSAFVTKAEFDAALSDFNARLTTFEAGINSKIDSQVSPYLDRNGIWNGKTQTINTSNLATVNTFTDTSVFKPIPSGGLTIYRNGFGTKSNIEAAPTDMSGSSWGTSGSTVNIYNASKSFSSGWYIGGTQCTDQDVQDKTLFIANKSGLVFAPYTLERGKSVSGACYVGGTNQSWATAHPSYGISWSSIFKMKIGSNVSASVSQSRTVLTSVGWSPSPQWDSVPAETINGACIFFVTKGDDVHLVRAWSIGGNQSYYVVTSADRQSAVASKIAFRDGIKIY